MPKSVAKIVPKKVLKKAFSLMSKAKVMTELYEENFKVVSKYVHATSRGHEAIQIATGLQLLPQDFVYPYYRDDALIMAMGMTPYDLMLQLMAKADDPFSGGRSYYSHPSLKDDDKPKIPHQSSATGMQAIPATGSAMGFQYKEKVGIATAKEKSAVVVCSLGDASVTEGEVAEAFQMAALKQLPILYLIQDNEWDISASADEIRAQNAFEYIKGFHGIEAFSIDGSNFIESYDTITKALKIIRTERRPVLVHAKVPLLNHHTSGVRMEWYRDDLDEDRKEDPFPKLRTDLICNGLSMHEVEKIESQAINDVKEDYQQALLQADPSPESLTNHIFDDSINIDEQGERNPVDSEKTVMVDCALHAIEEIMHSDKNALLYGQDVGGRLGGVFREAATLAQKFGDDRVFNTPIQEAFIVGSTVGMSAVGLKPIVEVQFADYIFPGLNQLFTEVSRSCYLSNGKYPVSMILRVPIGAYGSGGPYHSSSVETIVTNIKGLKIAYPSNGADLKGLLKAAHADNNPCVIFEHKGLYWSKVPGTDAAKVNEPDTEYILPFGIAKCVHSSPSPELSIITYGMGVHWATNLEEELLQKIEIIDLRTLSPLDKESILISVNKCNKCIVLTEEPTENSFARNLAGMIQEACFENLDGPVRVIGSVNTPAIPLNSILEQTMIPNTKKLAIVVQELLNY